jgi:hypothetical protein
MRRIKKTKKRHHKKIKRSIRRSTKRHNKSRNMRKGKMRGGDYDSHIPSNPNTVMIVKQDGMFIPMSQDLYDKEYKQKDVEKNE